jgi:Fe-S cluster assembly iron-binding protein IscA
VLGHVVPARVRLRDGPHDKEFEIDGVKVVCDKKSYLYLNGTTLDYVTQG